MGKVTTSWFVWKVPVDASYPRIIINSNNNFSPFTLSKGVLVCTIKYKVILYIRLFTIWLLLISPGSSLTVTVPVPRSHNKPLPVFQICYIPGSLCPRHVVSFGSQFRYHSLHTAFSRSLNPGYIYPICLLIILCTYPSISC